MAVNAPRDLTVRWLRKRALKWEHRQKYIYFFILLSASVVLLKYSGESLKKGPGFSHWIEKSAKSETIILDSHQHLEKVLILYGNKKFFFIVWLYLLVNLRIQHSDRRPQTIHYFNVTLALLRTNVFVIVCSENYHRRLQISYYCNNVMVIVLVFILLLDQFFITHYNFFLSESFKLIYRVRL